MGLMGQQVELPSCPLFDLWQLLTVTSFHNGNIETLAVISFHIGNESHILFILAVFSANVLLCGHLL